MRTDGGARTDAARELTRPAAWVALGVLVVNDHWLKGAALLPGWATGKISDFAGLFLAPLVLGALAGLVFRPGHRVRAWLPVASAIAVGVGFALVKVSAPVNTVVGHVWGPAVLDATDLVALPMCGLSVWYMARCRSMPRRSGRAVRLASLAAGLLACAATSPAPRECHPSWRLLTAPAEIGCARLEGWVSKSGKEGFGITLAMAAVDRTEDCVVRLTAATFSSGAFRGTPPALPAPSRLTAGQTYVYLPFPFDNQALWSTSGDHGAPAAGTVTIELTAGDVTDRLTIRATQEVHPRHQKYGERYGGACDAPQDPARPSRLAPRRDAEPETSPNDAAEDEE